MGRVNRMGACDSLCSAGRLQLTSHPEAVHLRAGKSRYLFVVMGIEARLSCERDEAFCIRKKNATGVQGGDLAGRSRYRQAVMTDRQQQAGGFFVADFQGTDVQGQPMRTGPRGQARGVPGVSGFTGELATEGSGRWSLRARSSVG